METVYCHNHLIYPKSCVQKKKGVYLLVGHDGQTTLAQEGDVGVITRPAVRYRIRSSGEYVYSDRVIEDSMAGIYWIRTHQGLAHYDFSDVEIVSE